VLVIVAVAVFTVVRAVRIVPQATSGLVERFGRYHRTLNSGLNIVPRRHGRVARARTG
jgi:regulator of protease activity HflC (stomatin/prohibitin superfamily)